MRTCVIIIFALVFCINTSAQTFWFGLLDNHKKSSLIVAPEGEPEPPEASYFNSADYYVRSDASGSGDGTDSLTNAWTLAQLNAATLVAGDSVAFKHDDSFFGKITVGQSGTVGNEIVYGTYGSGAKAKIYSSQIITGWSVHSGNIYKATFNTDIDQLFVDDVRMTVARYPNTGYYDITTVNSPTQFVSTDVSGGTDYTGASWVGRTRAWGVETKTVTASSSQTLTLNSAPYYSLGVGEGFVLVDKLDFLDQAGEWYYDTSTNTVYLWTENGDSPSNYSVRGSTESKGIYAFSKNNITIQDIQLIGSSSFGIHAENCSNLTIKNVDILYPEKAGIHITNVASTGNLIDSCYVEGANHNAAYIEGGFNTITDCTFKNTGLFDNLGISGMGDVNNGGRALHVTGLHDYANPVDGNIIRYNRVINTAYHGIGFFNSINTLIEYNYVKSACLVKDDGGGIYCYNTDYANQGIAGSKIRYNIVEDVIGTTEGYTSTIIQGNGIYLDEKTHGVTVEHNIVINSGGYGIMLHQTTNDTVRHNTVFNFGGGIRPQNIAQGGNIISNNTFVNIESAQWGDGSNARMFILDPADNSLVEADYNTYVDHWRSSPFYRTDNFSYMDFTAWKGLTGDDANSTFDGSTLPAGDYEKLLYNDTKSAIDTTLTGTWKYLNGTSVTFPITIQPFESIILTGQ